MHALLSPSGASRWLACTPSARLEQQFPDSTSEFAKEGTLAHKLGELLINFKLKLISKANYGKELKKIQADELYDHSMMGYCEDYAAFVIERFAEAKGRTSDAKIHLETKLDMSEYVPEGFGTGDVCIVADEVLDFIDLKYGKGVEVSAVNNKQMMLYALGLLSAYDFLYSVSRIRMTIYQPRIDNISEWEIEVEELRLWAEEQLKPKAALAFKGEGEFVPGDHCRFCRARPTCRAHAEMQLEIAQHDFKAPLLLEDNEVADVLSKAKDLESWLKEVKDYALSEAVNNNKKWPGFKLVEGRSIRVFTDTEAIADKLIKDGYKEEDIYKPRDLIGITAMEGLLTKKIFNVLLSPFVAKPPGSPALVPASDKRPELNSIESANADFAEPLVIQ